jgi:chromosome segregation ATPase
VSQEELDRVKRDADERVAEMQRQMQEDAGKADPDIEALREQLARAEARAKGAEDALAAARADVAAALDEVESMPTTNGEVSGDLIEELEAKVAEAEARAKEAEEEALRLTPEANDLRARLTQAAARKKFGPSS